MTVPGVEWGVAALTLPGQDASGDRCIVRPRHDGIMIGVIDGLGHGPDAAKAAECAITIIERHKDETLIAIANHCHKALTGTRGAVLSLARISFDVAEMAWLGVGNVEGILVRGDSRSQPPRETLLLRNGVVGDRLPALVATILPIAPGDTLVFATDGVNTLFAPSVAARNGSPQAIADRILAGQAKGTDDALVLVLRYVGPEKGGAHAADSGRKSRAL